MTEFVRTAEENFQDLSDFRHEPSYHAWQDLRMHYVDVGPRDAPVMLLLHGMPHLGVPVPGHDSAAGGCGLTGASRRTTWVSVARTSPPTFIGTRSPGTRKS